MRLEWFPLKEYEGYEINWNGEVRSVDRMVLNPETKKLKWRKGRPLKHSKNAKGSPQVSLIKPDGKRKVIRVHSLMVMAFSNVQGGLSRAEDFLANKDSPVPGKVYEFTSPDGDYVKVTNLSKFCKENNLYSPNLCQVHSGKLKQSKGWKKFVVTSSQ